MAGDTLAAQIAESTQETIEAVKLQLENYSELVNLARRKDVMKGFNAVEFPYATTVPTVETPTEGDRIANTYQFDMSSVSVSPSLRVLSATISKIAAYESQDDVQKLISRQFAKAQAKDIAELLITATSNFTTLGNADTNTPLSVAGIRDLVFELAAVQEADGGPVSGPFVACAPPLAMNHLVTNLGAQGVVQNTAPWIPDGPSAQLMTQMLPNNRLGMPLFDTIIYRENNFTSDGNGDVEVPVFSTNAEQNPLNFAVWWQWDMEVFKPHDLIGVFIRADAFYNTVAGPYTAHGGLELADND